MCGPNDNKFACIAKSAFEKFAFNNNFNISMPAPKNICIETIRLCNGACKFCPASTVSGIDDPKRGNYMSNEVFDRICMELQSIDFAGRISLFVNNEPLLDQDLPRKIKKIHQHSPKAILRVMTNGNILTESIAETLFGNGLHTLDISNYTASNRLENLTTLLQQKYQKHTVRLFSRNENAELFNRAGHNPLKHNPAKSPYSLIGCIYPFLQLNIAQDGTIGQCCCDFFFEYSWGNIVETSIMNIWNGNKAKCLRKQLLSVGRIENRLCRICDYPGCKRDCFPSSDKFSKSLSLLFPKDVGIKKTY